MHKQLANVLQVAGLGVVGESIFVDSMPPGAPGILIRSNPMGDPRDEEIPRMILGSVMLIARGNDYEATRDLVTRAAAALVQEFSTQKVVDGYDIRRVVQKTNPVTYPPAQGNQREFSVSIGVTYFDVV